MDDTYNVYLSTNCEVYQCHVYIIIYPIMVNKCIVMYIVCYELKNNLSAFTPYFTTSMRRKQLAVSNIYENFLTICAARFELQWNPYFICGAWLVSFVPSKIQMLFLVYTRLGYFNGIANSQLCIQNSEKVLIYFCSKVWHWTLQQLQYSWKLYSM